MHKIILADNHSVFRTGMAKLLSMEENVRVVAQCPNVELLQKSLQVFNNTIVIFASTLNLDPLLLMSQIASAKSRGIAIIENSEPAHPFLAAHVHGLFCRSITGPTLVDLVRRVGFGERCFHSAANTSAVSSEDLVGARVRDRLTAKEMAILALIVQGCKNKEIAFRLGNTEQVIKNHLRGVYDKTGTSDRLELALFTIHHHILAEAAAAAGNLIAQAKPWTAA